MKKLIKLRKTIKIMAWTCKNCGYVNDNGSSYCTHCE